MDQRSRSYVGSRHFIPFPFFIKFIIGGEAGVDVGKDSDVGDAAGGTITGGILGGRASSGSGIVRPRGGNGGANELDPDVSQVPSNSITSSSALRLILSSVLILLAD